MEFVPAPRRTAASGLALPGEPKQVFDGGLAALRLPGVGL
jgi:hypothetical protein